MPKFHVSASVIGSKYIGCFEAKDKEEAIRMAEVSEGASVSFCHQCDSECEDPQTDEFCADDADENEEVTETIELDDNEEEGEITT